MTDRVEPADATAGPAESADRSAGGRDRSLVRRLNLGDAATDVRIDSIASFMHETSGARLVVCDRNTSSYAGDGGLPMVEIAAGETGKSWESVTAIVSAGLREGLARNGLFIGVGGGALCDVAAFAASIYMRGCRVSLVPTTLLSMVDAAVGGKTAIDLEGAKNLVGSFYPAETVLIDLHVLETLPDREYRSGLVEGIKHALLGDPELLEMFRDRREAVRKRDPACVERIIRGSIRVKGDIVERDLRESGVRAHLNLGHTFGHALESTKGFGVLTHGEAVAWGIAKGMELGVELGITNPDYAEECRRLLVSYEYPVEGVEADACELLRFMRADKKRRSGAIRCALQGGPGQTVVVEVDDETILRVLSSDSAINQGL